MSLSTLTTPDFDDWDRDLEFEAIVEHYDEPVRRTQRWVSEREAIAEGLGFRRHRSRERGQ